MGQMLVCTYVQSWAVHESVILLLVTVTLGFGQYV
jgi:hypothetical protein